MTKRTRQLQRATTRRIGMQALFQHVGTQPQPAP